MSTDPYSNAPNPVSPQPSGSKAPIIIIVVVVVVMFSVAFCGILAAIAIPAFLRYVKKSKAAESGMVLRQMDNVAQMHILEHCEFPPELPHHSDIKSCFGGAKCLPNGEIPPPWDQVSALSGPTYFVYSAHREGDGMILRAEADFNVTSHQVHREELRIDLVDCTATSDNINISNEFE